MPGHVPVRILTVSRQFGAGGEALARKLGERLGWRVVGREVVRKIAAELRMSEEDLAERDERVRGLVERVGIHLAGAFPELVPPPFPPSRVDDETVRVLCEAVLREAVRLGPVILVGHGAQCLFGDRDDALHARIVAPRDVRARRLATERGFEVEEAREEVVMGDAARKEYLQHHYGRDWTDPDLYHVILNVGRLEVGEAVALLEATVRRRGAAGSPEG